MKKLFSISFLLPILSSIFLSVFFVPFLATNTTSFSVSSSLAIFSPVETFLWPLPNHTTITSKFGYRQAPTTGASTYHGGIDIAAPAGTKILSIADGIVSYIGWYGANGYTIILQHENKTQSIYGHISPKFLLSVGDSVKKGECIAEVGPKYIEKKPYTNYQDSRGNYTNGATTGPHLHLSITENHKKRNPEDFF